MRKTRPDAHEIKIIEAQTDLTQARLAVECSEKRIADLKTELRKERANHQRLCDAVTRSKGNLTRHEHHHAKYLVGELTAKLFGEGLTATPQAIIAAAKEEHRPRIAAFFFALSQAGKSPSAEAVGILESENAPTAENVDIPVEDDRGKSSADDRHSSENPPASDEVTEPASPPAKTPPLETAGASADGQEDAGAVENRKESAADADPSASPPSHAPLPAADSADQVPATPPADDPVSPLTKSSGKTGKGERRAAGTALLGFQSSVITNATADQSS